MTGTGCPNIELQRVMDGKYSMCDETHCRWQCARNYQFLLRRLFANKEYQPKENQQRPSILFVAGGPCSGKSTLVHMLQEQGIIVPAHSIVISGDVLSDLLAYKYNLSSHPENTSCLRTTYQFIRKLIIHEALERGYQVIITTHLTDITDCRALVDLVRTQGGLSMIVAAITTPDTFSLFADAQEQQTNRRIDREEALTLHRNFPRYWSEIIKVVDAHMLLDNSIRTLRTNGGPDVSIIGGRISGTTTFNEAVYQAFLDKQPEEVTAQSLPESVNIEEAEAALEQEAISILQRLAEMIMSESCKQRFTAFMQRLETG